MPGRGNRRTLEQRLAAGVATGALRVRCASGAVRVRLTLHGRGLEAATSFARGEEIAFMTGQLCELGQTDAPRHATAAAGRLGALRGVRRRGARESPAKTPHLIRLPSIHPVTYRETLLQMTPADEMERLVATTRHSMCCGGRPARLWLLACLQQRHELRAYHTRCSPLGHRAAEK